MKLLKHVRLGSVAALAAGTVIGLVAAASASAGTVAATTKTHHLSLAASAFAPDHIGNPKTDYYNNWDPSALTDSGDRCFNAGLAVPDGAAIQSVIFEYTRGTSGSAFNAQLNRQDLVHHTDLILATISEPSGASHQYIRQNYVLSHNKTVNMATYAYSFGICPNGNSSFTGVTVTYTTTS